MKFIFQKDPTFSFELLRTAGYAVYGGADIGECLRTACRIEEGDFESWYQEWNATARRVHRLADQAMADGQPVGARDAYLRASNYYRTAEFFLHGDSRDPRILQTWGAARATFRAALPLMGHPAEAVQIPFEGRHLTGYFFRPSADGRARPTLMAHGGYDSIGEELYLEIGVAALQRGYNFLAFEGPGQGAMIREHGQPFRSNWESVVSPAVDWLVAQPGVAPSRIALMGISLGGLLAPRAAAFEHRLAALVANDGMFTFHFGEKAGAFMKIESLFGRAVANLILKRVMKRQSGVRWAVENGRFTFQQPDVWALIQATADWTLDGVSKRIQCPTLVCDAEHDHFFAGQPQALFDSLTCPKTLMVFKEEDAAGEHCQFGALLHYNQAVFQWLDGVLSSAAAGAAPPPEAGAR